MRCYRPPPAGGAARRLRRGRPNAVQKSVIVTVVLAMPAAGGIRAGDVVAWCKPVAVTAAVVRGDGRVQAAPGIRPTRTRNA
jgi:hypothetical protein